MFKNFKKITLLGLASLPAVALTSCSTISQYYPAIYIKGINMDEYRIAYNTDKSIYKDGTKVSSSTDYMKDFIKFYLTGVVSFLNLSNSLVNVAHFGEDRIANSDSVYTNNLIFGDSNTESFKEFMLASANILNQGRKNQLKLSVAEVNIKSADNTSISSFDDFLPKNGDTVNIDKVAEDQQISVPEGKVYLYLGKDGTVKTVNEKEKFPYASSKDKTSTGYSSTYKTITADVTYKYFDPSNNNVIKDPKTLEDVQNYVNSNNAWGGVTPTKDSFTVSFNLKVKLRPRFTSLKTYIEKDKGTTTLTDDEKKELVKIDDSNTDVATTTIENWSYGDKNEGTNSSLFKNWSYDSQFSSYNVTPTDSDIYLQELNKTTETNLDGFSNYSKLNDYLGNIASIPKLNSADSDYNAFITEVKKFQHFLSYSN